MKASTIKSLIIPSILALLVAATPARAQDTIRLVPAWPKDWNASFKLHAPKSTTVEGRVANGKVIDLKVTPESRRKDVLIGAE